MAPTLAFLIWFLCLAALFIWDPARNPKVSIALWLPVVWLFFAGSRLPSQWLGVSPGSAEAAIEEGDPLNRAVSFGLILLAICILLARSINWRAIIARNPALVAYILFALLSACWSDFSLLCLKRWFRDLGGYLVVLVVLTDQVPLEAIRTLLRRMSYLLIPLSIVFDKYYPERSRLFDPWTGSGMFVGVTTGKNELGSIALISGLFFVWDTVARWPEHRRKRTKRILAVNAGFVLMNLSLLKTAESATCRVCFGLGCFVIFAANSQFFKRHPTILKALIPSIFCLYLLLDVGLGMNGSMAHAIGKDPTLTDRTKIWAFLLGMHTNPIIGTGYESFWYGPRLEYFWQNAGLGPLNEAHNGFLEVYLQLGVLGLLVILWLIVASYRNICKKLSPHQSIVSLALGIWVIMLFYCVTEAGFRMALPFVVFLIFGTAVPLRREGHQKAAKSAEFVDARPWRGQKIANQVP